MLKPFHRNSLAILHVLNTWSSKFNISLVKFFLQLKNGNDVPEHYDQLASFYWLPKLHKKLYGSRFIAASNKYTTKQLSSLLTSSFKTILTHNKQYCDGIYIAF